MGQIFIPTHCPVCRRELEHRANVEYEPAVKGGVALFHKDDGTPVCKEASADRA